MPAQFPLKCPKTDIPQRGSLNETQCRRHRLSHCGLLGFSPPPPHTEANRVLQNAKLEGQCRDQEANLTEAGTSMQTSRPHISGYAEGNMSQKCHNINRASVKQS